MDNKELKKLLGEAKHNREYGEFAKALAILHQIKNEFPTNATYCYLLAVTYFESWNTDTALTYAIETLVLDVNHKESYELIGDIYSKLNNTELALENYLRSYKINPKYTFFEEKLIELYLKEKDYEAVVKICNNMMNHIPIDISSVKARGLTMIYYGAIIKKRIALIYLKKYREAIGCLIYQINFEKDVKLPSSLEPYSFLLKEKFIEIYKMYFKLNDKDNIKEYSTILLEKYKITDGALKEIEVEAINDIILPQQRTF
jgi:tetratricopeptide (TPR) repeat protein